MNVARARSWAGCNAGHRVPVVDCSRTPLRTLAVALVLGALAGCYADKPAATPDDALVDAPLAGYWCFPVDGTGPGEMAIAVVRLDEREMVVAPVADFRPNEAMRVFASAAGADARRRSAHGTARGRRPRRTRGDQTPRT